MRVGAADLQQRLRRRLDGNDRPILEAGCRRRRASIGALGEIEQEGEVLPSPSARCAAAVRLS